MYKRGRVWYISVGGTRQSSGTPDRERAKALEHKLNSEAWDLEHGLIVPIWDRACLKWMDDNPALAERGAYKNWARWWKPFLTGKRLATITPPLIHKIIAERRKAVSLNTRTKANATANAYVAFVNRVIRHVSNLKPAFQMYPPMPGNDRWASVEEWLSVATKLTQDELDVLTFGLVTGLREENVMFFEWKWEHGTWATVPGGETKTAVPYGVPLNRTAQAILERRRAMDVKHVRYVFSKAGKAWYRVALLRALGRACKATEVHHLTVHALRHTFGTWLARAGVPREIRMRLMAHTLTGAHDKYIHHDVESLRPYAEIIDTLLSQGAQNQRKLLAG